MLSAIRRHMKKHITWLWLLPPIDTNIAYISACEKSAAATMTMMMELLRTMMHMMMDMMMEMRMERGRTMMRTMI